MVGVAAFSIGLVGAGIGTGCGASFGGAAAFCTGCAGALLVGGRLSEVPSQGYELLGIPTPQQALVHINADADELGKLYRHHFL